MWPLLLLLLLPLTSIARKTRLKRKRSNCILLESLVPGCRGPTLHTLCAANSRWKEEEEAIEENNKNALYRPLRLRFLL
jgi:hypothetical protein